MNSSTERATGTGSATLDPQRGLGDRLRSGMALNLIAAGFNQGSTLAVNLVVANLLGRETFGRYTMVLATVATLGTLGQMSMGYTATKHIAEFRTVDPARASRVLSLCAAVSLMAATLVALALAAGSDWLAQTVLDAPDLGLELRLAAAAVLFTVLNGFLSGALAGMEGYAALARVGVISGTAYALICSILAWQFGLPGAVGGLAASALVQAAALSVFTVRETARHGLWFTRVGLWEERAIIANFALPASISGALYQPAAWVGTALLARQPAGFQHVAVFGAANMFRTMVLFLPQVINNVGMAVLNHQRRSNPRGYRKVFWLNAGISIAAAVGGAGLLIIAGALPLRLFGPDFTDGRHVLVIMLAAAIIETVSLAVYQLIVSRGHIWASLAFVSIPRDVTLVALSIVLVPLFGAAGLAWAYAAAWTLSLIGVIAVAFRNGGDGRAPAVAVSTP